MPDFQRKPGVRTCLLPDFDHSVFQGYAVRYMERNYWRISKVYDWEDAIQLAAWCFYDTRVRYGGRVQTPQHFMALYKRCLCTWLTDDAQWETRIYNTESAYAEKCPESTTGSEAYLSVLLREASKELKDVLGIIINAPEEVLGVLKADLKSGIDCFFKNSVVYAGIPEDRAPILEKELRGLLE